MTDVVSTEFDFRPRKIPKLQKDCEVSKPPSKRRELRCANKEDDEYLRQYMLFHYQKEKTQGFSIDWEQFDYVMPIESLDYTTIRLSDKLSNAELIRKVTLLAIDKHNEARGTKLKLVEHIEANFRCGTGIQYWLTFRARDMSSESKIYQAQVSHIPHGYRFPLFRLKPTDQEIDAIQVKPPPPMYYHYEKLPIAFALAGPEDGAPFVFDRTGAGHSLYADYFPDDD